MKLRHYQNTAVEKTYEYWNERTEPGLIILPTGTGKSLVIAELCKLTKEYPQTRIIVATHNQDLVGQDFQELISLWNEAPAGIYSAGLRKRDVHQKILFVGIQSVYQKAFVLQRCDILIIDEAHTIPREAQTMWGKFISDLMIINPHMRVLGLTATAYRMDSGNLIDGEDSLFKHVIYEYTILEAVQDGYLCEVVSKSMATKLHVTRAQLKSDKQIEAAVNVDALTKAAVDEVFQYGHDRHAWLIFGAGVDHATAIAAEITSRGVDCAVITKDTAPGDRVRIIANFKNGTQKAVSNNKIMTTGTNVPRIDLIADMAPTESSGLFVQKVGRGARPIFAPGFDIETKEGRLAAIAASVKPNCLLLDFANNLPRHGCIDKIKGYAPMKGDGIAPVKDCLGNLKTGEEWKEADGLEAKCATILHASVMTCKICGFKFPEPELKINATATTHAVLSNQVEREYRRVISVSYKRHDKPGAKVPTLRIDYVTEGFVRVSEWKCLEHHGQIKDDAHRWWKRRLMPQYAHVPVPETVDAALGMVQGLLKPSEIVTVKEGKYNQIIGYKFEEVDKPIDVKVSVAEQHARVMEVMDDDLIPF